MIVTLTDLETKQEHQVSINVTNGFIEIGFTGFGEAEAEDGDGTPIVIEMVNGVPVVRLFHDINSAEPMTVRMDNARESLRIHHEN